jgi:5'-nucleotidase
VSGVAGGPQVLVTNDDGAGARGIDALTAALVAAGLEVVVVAPAVNQSGTSRTANYSRPVLVEPGRGVDGAESYVCHGSPVDCVRAALVGEVAPRAALVVSGINHGGNFGDDTLGSGTFGAAVEGALLGLPALAVSQQSYPGHFSLLDSLDQTTPIYEETALVAAHFAAVLLERGAPDRAVLNVNMPSDFSDRRVELTRPGRRFWKRHAVEPFDVDGARAYLTFGTREQPDADWGTIEFEPGTDFAAVADGRGSASPFSFAWHEPAAREELDYWALAVTEDVNRVLATP